MDRFLQKKYVQKASDFVNEMLLVETSGTFAVTRSISVSSECPEISAFDGEPLLNFCQLLVLSCSRLAPEVFHQLFDRYQPMLSVKNNEALLRLEKTYYPVMKKQSQQAPLNLGNMINSMLQGMFTNPQSTQAPPDID